MIMINNEVTWNTMSKIESKITSEEPMHDVEK